MLKNSCRDEKQGKGAYRSGGGVKEPATYVTPGMRCPLPFVSSTATTTKTAPSIGVFLLVYSGVYVFCIKIRNPSLLN